MPVMNGYEATIKIKKDNPEIIIIALTAGVITGEKEKNNKYIKRIISWKSKVMNVKKVKKGSFIGYGTFSLAAMVGFAYLIKEHGQTASRAQLIPLFILGAVLCAEPFVFGEKELSIVWVLYFGLGAIIVGAILALRKPIANKLPSLEILDDIMYRAIAVGFAFFTLATILGALWAADAWGTYWQWDPKETWALIVWLNYAAWLHMRLMKGLRGSMAAYWALGGLLITSFAFLGVNMFLSGLHSYGEL